MTVVRARQRRDMWLLGAAATVSAIGDGMTIVAVPLLAASVTDDPRVVSGLRVAALLPWLTLGLAAGAVADRVSRRRLMVAADLVRAALVCAVALVAAHEFGRLWPLYALMCALGTAQTVFDSAAQAFLPEIVDADGLERGNGLLLSGQSAGLALIGPPLGGALFAWSPAAPFIVDAASFLASAALLLTIRRTPGAVARTAAVASGLGREIWQAIRYVATRPLLRTFAILVGVVNLSNGMTAGVLVLFATHVLGLSASGFGVLVGVESAGALAGGLLARRITERLGTRRTLRLSIVVTAVTPILLGLAPVPWAAMAVVALDGVALMVWGVAAVSLRQRVIPADLLARTAALYRVVGLGLNAVGALVGGYLAYAVSLRAPFLVGGAVACGVVILVVARLAEPARP